MRSDADRERLRQTFATASERYDRIRPTYPEAIVDRLAELVGLSPGDRVLELGAGTGQLTRSRSAAVTRSPRSNCRRSRPRSPAATCPRPR